MTMTSGARLEIVAPIGAGGMGEVYRAQDTRQPSVSLAENWTQKLGDQ